jgi:hypothetical protein
VRGAIPRDDVAAARDCFAGLARYVDRQVPAARLALDHIESVGFRRRYVARAHITAGGRVLAARAIAPSAAMAADIAAERLRRQLGRITGAYVALRNEPDRQAPSPPPVQRKPPAERAVVPRHTYATEPEPTLSAVADLLDLGEEFHLFSHVRTGEDVVVHWRDDRRIGLLFPPGSRLADENGVVIPTPSRYSSPSTFDAVRAEMDALEHRFLYFVHAEDERGKVLYLRFDGDYGLVQPW